MAQQGGKNGYPEKLDALPDGEYACKLTNFRVGDTNSGWTIANIAFTVTGVDGRDPGATEAIGRSFESAHFFGGPNDKFNPKFLLQDFKRLGYAGAERWGNLS